MKKKSVCPTCGNKFENNRGNRGQTYCSVSCGLSKPGVCVKLLVCELCKGKFEFKGRTKAKYCPACRPKAASRRTMLSRASRDPSCKVGVGSGNNQHGNNKGSYKGKPRRPSRSSKDYRQIGLQHYGNTCGVCGANGRRLNVHHRNGDETDHHIENLIPLCYSCHRRVHFVKVPQADLEQRLQKLIEEGRSKIAEKTGNPSSGQSEVKSASNAAGSRND